VLEVAAEEEARVAAHLREHWNLRRISLLCLQKARAVWQMPSAWGTRYLKVWLPSDEPAAPRWMHLLFAVNPSRFPRVLFWFSELSDFDLEREHVACLSEERVLRDLGPPRAPIEARCVTLVTALDGVASWEHGWERTDGAALDGVASREHGWERTDGADERGAPQPNWRSSGRGARAAGSAPRPKPRRGTRRMRGAFLSPAAAANADLSGAALAAAAQR
jgi:hypothetical protein